MPLMLPVRRDGARRCARPPCGARLEYSPHVFTTKIGAVAVGHIVRKKSDEKNLLPHPFRD